MEREKYKPPREHKLDPKWFENLDERHKELHVLAQEKLESSYFADRTHGITKELKRLAEVLKETK